MINTSKYWILVIALVLFILPSSTFAAPHNLGTNIKSSDGTVYTITTENGVTVRRPYTSAGAFLSYSYNSWSAAVTASAEDLTLPVGSFIPPQDGKIICSDRGFDKGTCYLITNKYKAGFTSETVFKQLGYSFSNAIYGDVSFLTNTDNIDRPTMHHPSGSLVNIDGTVYLVAGNVLLGLPNWQTLQDWGYKSTDIIPANEADRSLLKQGVVTPKTPGQISPPTTSSSNSPILIVSSYFAHFNYTEGDTESRSTDVSVSNNSASQSLSFRISVPNQPDWLNTSYNTTQDIYLSPLQSAGIGVSVDPTGLEEGDYETTIYLTGNFSNSPATIDVTLKVYGFSSSQESDLKITTTSLPDATYGSPYSYKLKASGGTGPYTWSYLAFKEVNGPSRSLCCILGIGEDGSITTQTSGTMVIEPGDYLWNIQVTDSAGAKTNKTLDFTIEPQDSESYFVIFTDELQAASVGDYYSSKISFNYYPSGTNYASNATFSGLPPGITTGSASSPNTTYGIISSNPKSVSLVGTPTAAGTYYVTLTLDDQYGATTTEYYTLVVSN